MVTIQHVLKVLEGSAFWKMGAQRGGSCGGVELGWRSTLQVKQHETGHK